MSEKEPKNLDEKEEHSGISRRDFLKNAGLVAGGATLGSMALLNACNNGGSAGTSTVTVTKTVTPTGAAATTSVAQTATDMFTLNVNGKAYYVKAKDHWTLAYVLREKMGLTGTKRGCQMGACGACTVLVDGRPISSCITLAVEVQNKDIRTIEGEQTAAGKLSTMQQAFVDGDACQCGFCIPGTIMAAKALLVFKAKPNRADIQEFLSGNLCRCGVHQMAIDAIIKAAG